MADEVVNISIQADIRQLREQLATLPGVGDKEAAKMVRALERQYQKAEQAARRASSQATRDWDRGLNQIKTVAEKALGKVGGVFGDLGDIVLDMGEKVGGASSVLGTAGTVAAGAALGVAALGTAWVQIAAAADEAAKRLEEAGHAAQISAEARASLEEYRSGMSSLRTETDAATVALGSDLAAAAGDAAAQIALLLDTVTRAKDAMSGTATAVTDWASLGVRALMAVSTAGSSELARAAREGVQARADVLATSNAAEGAGTKLVEEIRRRSDAATETVEKERAAEAEAAAAKRDHARAARAVADAQAAVAANARAVADAYRAEQGARQALAAVVADAGSDQLTAEDKINAAYAERVRRIVEAGEVTQDYAAAHAAEAAAEERRQRDLGDLRIDLERRVAEFRSRVDEALVESHEQAIERVRETIDEVGQGIGLVGEQLGSVQSIVESVSARMIEQAQDGTRAEREAALRAYRTAKALAIAGATVEAARAAISLLPSYAFLGPGAPIAAAATAGAALAATIAKIQAAPAPSFERGGVVPGGGVRGSTSDHVMVQAQPGEGVVNKRGMAALGRDGLARANRGEAPARQAPVRVGLSLNGREIAEALWDPLGSLVEGRPLGRRAAFG